MVSNRLCLEIQVRLQEDNRPPINFVVKGMTMNVQLNTHAISDEFRQELGSGWIEKWMPSTYLKLPLTVNCLTRRRVLKMIEATLFTGSSK